MKHISLQSDDIPAASFPMDRRRTPERRIGWRGGRRDSDWHNRPLGAWDRMPAMEPKTGWQRVLGTLHLW